MTGQSLSIGGISRRAAFRAAAGVTVAAAALAAGTKRAEAQTASDIDALNLVLNMEYLLAQFGTVAANLPVITADRLTGNGVAGVPPIAGQRVTFSDTQLLTMVTEIANDNRGHLGPIRFVIGALSARQPLMDISAGPTAPFTVAMQRAGVVPAGTTFNPYASEENFLYAMLLLKNISVAAYRGMAATISNRVVVQNFTGLLGAECIHASVIRSYLYARGATTPRLRENAEKIAAYQRSLNGGQAFQGVAPVSRSYPGGASAITVANVAPVLATGDVAGRTAAQTLNQLYLTAGVATSGGFFPEGVNGAIRSSAAA